VCREAPFMVRCGSVDCWLRWFTLHNHWWALVWKLTVTMRSQLWRLEDVVVGLGVRVVLVDNHTGKPDEQQLILITNPNALVLSQSPIALFRNNSSGRPRSSRTDMYTRAANAPLFPPGHLEVFGLFGPDWPVDGKKSSRSLRTN
jgi:hypothetical protein